LKIPKGNQKIPKGNQKIPKGGNQKIPKGGNQKIPKGNQNRRWTDNTMAKRKRTDNDLQNISHKTKDRVT